MKKVNTKIPMPKVFSPKVPRLGLPKIKRVANLQNPYRINKLR